MLRAQREWMAARKGWNPPLLLGAIDDLLGVDAWSKPGDWGTVLFTIPNASTWQVPTHTWHWDNPIGPHRERVAALHMFTVLAPLPPRSGATLFIEGLHHLTLAYYEDLPERKHRRRVMHLHPWLRQLMGTEAGPTDRAAYFMERPTRVDGAEQQVQEMTGEPGDVYLLHPLLAHSAAPNTSKIWFPDDSPPWPHALLLRSDVPGDFRTS